MISDYEGSLSTPDADPDMDPDADPGANPDMDPDADPDMDPGANPGANPDMDPGADPDKGFNEILKQGYFTYNEKEKEKVPGFTWNGDGWVCSHNMRNFIVSDPHSFWEPLPPGVVNPWEIDPYDRSADGYDEYIKQHTDDMVCFLYQIKGGEFTTRYVLNSPKYYNEHVYELSYRVTVPVTINGNPAEYTVTAISDSSATDDWETLFTIEFNGDTVGFPDDLSVRITELSSQDYMHNKTTWGLC